MYTVEVYIKFLARHKTQKKKFCRRTQSNAMIKKVRCLGMRGQTFCSMEQCIWELARVLLLDNECLEPTRKNFAFIPLYFFGRKIMSKAPFAD